MISTINYILASILILVNIQVLYQIIIGKISSFHPYALFSITVIAQLFPQLYVVLNNNYYNEGIIPNLLIMMISCQLAFKYGYNKGVTKTIKGKIIDINERSLKWLLLVFTIIGFIPMIYYGSMQSVYGGINVVLGQLRNIGMMSLILSSHLLLIKHDKSKKLLWSIIILSFIPLFYYGYFVKGSRQTLFSLFYIIIYFLLYFRSKWERKLSLSFLLAFIIGNILSVSMTEIRRYNNYHEDSATSLGNIKYWDNFKSSLNSPDLKFGMDLGNGALLIDYVYKNSSYDFGATIWNSFVYNYVPKRVIGENNKEYLYLLKNYRLEQKIDKECCGITYTTSYFNVFQMFSFFGFIVFIWIGYIIGRFKVKATVSTFYILAFLMSVILIPNMITGGIQYLLAALEMIFILLMPIWALYLKNKSIIKSYNKL